MVLAGVEHSPKILWIFGERHSRQESGDFVDTLNRPVFGAVFSYLSAKAYSAALNFFTETIAAIALTASIASTIGVAASEVWGDLVLSFEAAVMSATVCASVTRTNSPSSLNVTVTLFSPAVAGSFTTSPLPV